jgi:hypothetical protein
VRVPCQSHIPGAQKNKKIKYLILFYELFYLILAHEKILSCIEFIDKYLDLLGHSLAPKKDCVSMVVCEFLVFSSSVFSARYVHNVLVVLHFAVS